MSRTRLNPTLDTLRIIRLMIDEPDGEHTAYSVSHRLGLKYATVFAALKSLNEWTWVKRGLSAKGQQCKIYRLTDEGRDAACSALQSVGANIPSPRVFIGLPPAPMRVGISAST